MLTPSRSKFKKSFKGRMRSLSFKGEKVCFGDYGLKSLGTARLSPNQLESARRVLVKHLGKGAKLFLRIFPDIPVSKKPTDVRMGKGKGSVDRYIFRVSPGRILFEISGSNYDDVVKILDKFSAKLSVKCKITCYEEV
ncbi:50S ribosomal protein L16 [Anaplasmataceae bacterium AB001_6]|nr:50S ribosomal protein L16 [Anaplasmataceae bacterium AB001_6]